MRVEAYTQVQQLYKTKKNGRINAGTGVSYSDKVQISTIGKDIQAAKAAVANVPDVREEITAPIKAGIQAGTYSVTGEKFADKLLQKLEEMR